METTVSKKLTKVTSFLGLIAVLAVPGWSDEMPKTKEYKNFIGIKLARIEPGTFQMGAADTPLTAELTQDRATHPQGDFDEHPQHTVTITKPFYIGVYEVTNPPL